MALFQQREQIIHMVMADYQPVDMSEQGCTGLLKVSYIDYEWDCIPTQWVASITSSPYALLTL